jgi:chromosome segregation ATPase
LRSLSPVSPTVGELEGGLDVVYDSLDSRLITEMMESATSDSIQDVTARILSESPVGKSIHCADASVIIKCQSLLDELQEELDSQRERNHKLESELVKTKSELKEIHDQDYPSQMSALENVNADLGKRLLAAERSVESKDAELENMTRHFEKRMDEMRRQLKLQTTLASTPPIPAIQVTDEEVRNLREEIVRLSSKLKTKELEISEVTESYERQVSMLRQQLTTSQSFFKNYYSAKYCQEEDARCNPFRDY